MEGIQRLGAIAPDDHVPRLKILHRATKRVKLHRTMFIGSELANGNQILNKLRGNQNIIKVKVWCEISITSGCNGQQGTVTDNN